MPETMDLVANVVEKKPSEFQTNFSDLVTNRIRDLIAGKRVEIAKSLFTPPPPAETEPAPGVVAAAVDGEVEDNEPDEQEQADLQPQEDEADEPEKTA